MVNTHRAHRAAVAAVLLAALGCRERPTEPSRPAEPRLTLDSPADGQVLDDVRLVLRGVAESPGHVERVTVRYTTRDVHGYWVPAEEHLYYRGFGDSVRDRVEFDTSLVLPPGTQMVTLDMDYRLPDDFYTPHALATQRRIRVYRKPVLRIESGMADTLYQRSVSLIASITAIDSAPRIELVIDEGTSAERRVSDRTGSTLQIFAPRPPRGDTTAWLIELPDTLPNGPHRLVLRVYDETGVADSVVYPFVSQVAALPYTMALLPGLGGTSSDARDINASGTVAGWASDAGGVSRAVTWTNGVATTLPTRAGAGPSRAFALNGLGAVVGSVRDTVDGVYCERATRWTSTGVQLVGVGPDLCGQLAYDIAANGAMLIWKPCCGPGYYPNVNAWLVDAGTASGLPGALPLAVNDRSQVVGSVSFQGLAQPQPYSLGVKVELPEARPTLGHPAGSLVSINNASQVLGTFGSLNGRTKFLSVLPGSAPLDLNPFLSGATLVQVTDNGTVLSFDESSRTVFLWRGGRTLRVSLPATGWALDGVTAMNDAGDIVGHATEGATGRTSAVLLHPAP